jgi:hypothetical protein
MAEVLARIPSFKAIEGAQKGAEKSLAGQRIDGAMATFGTDLPLTSDLAICSLNEDELQKDHESAAGAGSYKFEGRAELLATRTFCTYCQ